MDNFLSVKADERKALEKAIAIALKYKKGAKEPPKVIAKGKGFMAEQIISKAIAAGVPVENNPYLANILSLLEIDEYIPFETFSAVAEILSILYKNEQKN